jgi:hypothetical protein
MARYLMRCNQDGSVQVYDAATGEDIGRATVWSEATRVCRIKNVDDLAQSAEDRDIIADRVTEVIYRHSDSLFSEPTEEHRAEARRFLDMLSAALSATH